MKTLRKNSLGNLSALDNVFIRAPVADGEGLCGSQGRWALGG